MTARDYVPTHDQTPDAPGQMGSYAPFYDRLMTLLTLGRERSLREITLDLASVRPGDRVLEAGCGTGTLSLAAKARVGTAGEVCGIDAAEEMIAVARRKGARVGLDVDFRVGQFSNLPFPDDRFDVVLCSFMIFHMPESLRLGGIHEVHRVLRPEGRFLIVDMAGPDDPRQRSLSGKLLGHMMQHDLRELLGPLEQAGFAGIEEGPTRYPAVSFIRGTAAKPQMEKPPTLR